MSYYFTALVAVTSACSFIGVRGPDRLGRARAPECDATYVPVVLDGIVTIAALVGAAYVAGEDCSTSWEEDPLGLCDAVRSVYLGMLGVTAFVYGSSTLYGAAMVSDCNEATDYWMDREVARAKRETLMYEYGTKAYCDTLFARLNREPEVQRARLVRSLPRDCLELLVRPPASE